VITTGAAALREGDKIVLLNAGGRGRTGQGGARGGNGGNGGNGGQGPGGRRGGPPPAGGQ
jgi:hypothetical protein